jgi:hypothetical protein
MSWGPDDICGNTKPDNFPSITMAKIISPMKPVSGYFSIRRFPFLNQLRDITNVPEPVLKAAGHGRDIQTA